MSPERLAEIRRWCDGGAYGHMGQTPDLLREVDRLHCVERARAAAPELLDALEKLYERFRFDHDHGGNDCPDSCYQAGGPALDPDEVLQLALKALGKAGSL